MPDDTMNTTANADANVTPSPRPNPDSAATMGGAAEPQHASTGPGGGERGGADNPAVAHEPNDVSIRGLAWFGVSMLISGIVVYFSMDLLFQSYGGPTGPHTPDTGVGERPADAPLPPEPRLQVSPSSDMDKWRAYEDAILNGYGWEDRRAGRVRIPIDRAMKLTAERAPKPRPEDVAASNGEGPNAWRDSRGLNQPSDSSSGRTTWRIRP
jgi:hypothetical protein